MEIERYIRGTLLSVSLIDCNFDIIMPRASGFFSSKK